MKLGEALRKEREAQGLSLRDLEKLAGILHATIGRIEQGRSEFPGFHAKIAKALSMSLDKLAKIVL